MARIISEINSATGRRTKIAGVEGGFRERSEKLGSTLGISASAASQLSSDQLTARMGSGTPASVAPQPLSTADLAPAKDMKLAPAPAPVGVAGGLGEMDAFTQSQQARVQETKQEYDKSKGGLDKFLQNRLSAEEIKIQQGDKAGLPDIQTEVRGYTDELTREQTKLARQVEAIQTAAGTATAGERDRQVRSVQRDSYRLQADISVASLAAQGRLADAQAAVDRAVALEFGDQEREIAHWERLVEDNKDLFTKAETRQYETLRDERKSKLDEARDVRMLELQEKIKQRDPAYQLGLQLTRAQISNTYSEIAKRNAETLAAGNAANFQTPPIINPKTGKPDPVGNLASVIKATGGEDNVNLQNTAGVMSALQAFAERNPGGNFAGTGPLGGFNMFKSAEGKTNEADLQAIELKVQQWASGASLTDSQTKMVANLTPKPGDLPSQLKAKTNGLTNFMLNQTRGTLAAQGINYQPGTVDFFDQKAPVNAFLDEFEAAVNSPSTLYSEAGYSL